MHLSRPMKRLLALAIIPMLAISAHAGNGLQRAAAAKHSHDQAAAKQQQALLAAQQQAKAKAAREKAKAEADKKAKEQGGLPQP